MQAQAGEADTAIVDARGVLTETEGALEEAREARSVWQVTQAQAQARLTVAKDRERRLNEEDATAAARLTALAEELSSLSSADQELAEQLGSWKVELDTQRKSLADAESRSGGRGARGGRPPRDAR